MPAASKSSSYHLRVFGFSLGLVVLALLGVLFGVRMEAVTHAAGVIQVHDTYEVRAGLGGVVELGWHEGEVHAVRFRVDRLGNGCTDPAQGESRKVVQFRCSLPPPIASGAETKPTLDQCRFHKLQPGDLLWPEQSVASIRADDLNLQLQRLKARLDDFEARKETSRETQVRYQTVRELLARSTVLAAAEGHAWQVLKVGVSQGQAVQLGELLAVLAPVDTATSKPTAWIAHLDIPEKHAANVAPGQEVRLNCTMFNHRLHGHADGIVEKIDPMAEPRPPAKERQLRAQVKITHTPFPLVHGSTVKAEIVLGFKAVYRIILEQ